MIFKWRNVYYEIHRDDDELDTDFFDRCIYMVEHWGDENKINNSYKYVWMLKGCIY